MSDAALASRLTSLINCGTCRHFKRYQAGQPAGTCHGAPPVPVMIGLKPPTLQGQAPTPVMQTHWPETAEMEGCGAHSDGPSYLQQPLPVMRQLDGIEIEGNA